MSVPERLECMNCGAETDRPILEWETSPPAKWEPVCDRCGSVDWREVPKAAAVVNGHRVVLDEDGLYYLWSPGVGFWGFGFKNSEGAIAAAEGVD